MSEFKVHHHVSELMNLLGTRSSDAVGAELYTDMLLKNMTPYITVGVSAHQAKRKIAETSETPIEFLAKYDELKARNIRDLDSLVFLLSKLAEEKNTKDYLEKHAKDKADAAGMSLLPHQKVTSQLPPPGSTLTAEEVSELKDQLLKESKMVSGMSTADLIKKAAREKAKRNVNIPHQPDWLFQRPALTMDFMDSVDEGADRNIVPLGSLPPALQEQAILEDMLCCMQGIEGKYILARTLPDRYAAKEFLIDQSLDMSFQELLRRQLSLCSDYSTVVRFIEEKSAFEYGLVNHALAAAMRTLIKEYMILIAQLEHQHRLGNLTLQKLWFYIQPTARTMDILASIANSVNRGECIGGAVLSLLHEKTSGLIGDAKGQELCLFLTQSACVPYFEILEKWIYKGIISDPYSEFLVEEHESIHKEKLQEDYNDAYWEQHYTICRERIPVFLEQVAQKILDTGKYLNVIRQCGRDVKFPNAEEIVYTLKERKYYEQIDKAHNYASKELLDLMEEKELMARIRSVKHYFLLDKGDFIVQFMDMTEDEMKQDLEKIVPSRLESLLELALRTSTANVDPFKDDLRVALLSYDLITQLLNILAIDTKLEKEYRIDPTDLHLSGLESFAFDYVVKWPISLVINRKALTNYQMLFRHLFYCKHVERQLCGIWVSNKSAKLYSLRSSRWYASAFALRQRMLNFIQNFEYYMMFEVIEHNWHIMKSNMESVSNVDEVLKYHSDFLDNCLKDCMLTTPDLLKTVYKIMMVCVTFSNNMQRLSASSTVESQHGPTMESSLQGMSLKDKKDTSIKAKASSKVMSEHVDFMMSSESFERMIASNDAHFSRLLLELLEKLMTLSSISGDFKLFNMLHRLDFNGFYTKKLEAMSAEKSMHDNSSTHSNDTGSTGSMPTTTFTSQRPDSARYVPVYQQDSSGSM